MHPRRILIPLTIFFGCWTQFVFPQDEIPEGAASLAFVFDITGSMYDDLVQVIDGAAKILATTLARREKPLYNYVLVPFHDPDIGPVVVTTDADDFQHELRNLYVQGGGDCPEMSIGAIKEALDVSLPNSFIYVFTDARSKDFELTEDVLAMIQTKQSQVVFVLTGDCDDPTHPGFRAYEQIASTSSGQVFLLKKSQVNELLVFVREAVQARKVNLMSIDVSGSKTQTFQIPIDTKLKEMTVSVSGLNPQITLRDPSGNRVTKENGLKTLLDINNAMIVNVKDPLPGQWVMTVQSNAPHTIRVTGLSSTDFAVGFSRKPLQDMKEIYHRPIGGIQTFTLINSTNLPKPGGFSRLELVDLKGVTLMEFPLIRDTDQPEIYNISSFMPPGHFFYVKVSGIDDKGFVIQRLTPTAISPQMPLPPEVHMPEVTHGYYSTTAVVTCLIESMVPYTVRWFREEVQKGTEQYFSDSGTAILEIPQASQFSEGIYTCNATNLAGSRAVQTFLDISEPPPEILVPSNVTVLPGNNAILHCQVFSTVVYNLTWYTKGFSRPLRSSAKYEIYSNDSLLVRNVVADDEGFYTCVAANEGGKTQDHVWILLQVVPTVVVTPGEVKFVAGESVSTKCSAVGFPTPILFWTRDGQALIADEHVVIYEGALTLHNAQQSDEGTYVCVARNPAGESRSAAVFRYMEVPNVYEYESRVLVASGDEAVLNCKADGIPKPDIKWFKGDLELKTVSYVQVNNGQMKIMGAQELDAGEYQCVAINDAGSDSATIKLEVGSEPVIIQAPNNLGVDIDGNATFPCRALGLPTPKIFWQREDGKRLDFTGRVKQLPSGSLFIEGVRVGDEGRYTCSAQNQFGIKEASAFLTVTGIVRPIIGYMEPTVSVIQGNDLELNCQVIMGNPRPKVQWVRRDVILQQDQHVMKNLDGIIVISDVQPRHEGDYMCFASNVGGNATFVVSVDVQVPPSFQFTKPEDEETQFSIIEGQGVVLPCLVAGDPPPFIEWFKDESPISPTDYHYFIREDGSLEIFSAEATDTGRYRCSASNIAGNLEKVMELFVQVPPIIAGDPSEELTVIENTTVTLTCEATGVPKPVIQWKRNFVPFKPDSKRFVMSDLGLTITEAKIMDKAIYECIASNLAGNETRVITLVVKIPPTILDKGETDITVLKDQEVLMTCENNGDPIPLVEWKKDETPMNIFDTTNGLNLLPTGSLQISSAKVKDTGKYVCIATNDAGVDTRDFSLKVHDPPSLPPNLVKKTDIIEQNSLILPCPANGEPKPQITWYKDGTLLSSNEVGIVLLEDGSLQIQDVKARNTGKYKCVAENVAGSIDHEVDVKVLVPPKIVGVDPKKATGIDNPKVVVKETATLTCPVESDPPPQITWLKNGKEMTFDDPESRVMVSKDGKVLTLARTEVEDTARYTCIAENVAGEVEKSFDLDVQVPPKIDEESATKSNISIIVGNPLYLDCPVSGIPRPKILWYKNGEIISPDLDPNIRVYAEGRRLEIVNVRVLDTGNYKCVAENVVGKTDRGFGVDVHVPPSIDNPGEVEKEEVVTGGSISLTCPASGIPVPTITWFKHNEPIRENSTNYLLLNQGWTLEIRSVSVIDTSRYTCRASNVAGENEKTFDINVLVPPKFKLEEVDLFPKVIINQTIVINCPVEGIPQPEITWYKNNVLLDGSIKKRYEILSNGRQLRITGAQLADTANYTCQAVNKAGENKLSIELEVLVPARIDIQSTNTNPKVVVNGSVTILCPAVGVPPPVIIWYKDDVEIKEESNIRILKGGQELVIANAEVGDTGQYKCQATNEAGQSEIGYKVDVQVPPSIPAVDIDTSPHVTVNNDVILACPASGIPKPNIIWLRDGQPIDFVTERHLTVSAEGQRLHIKGAQVDDAAIYTCVAANEAGSTEQTYDLDVWVPPKIDQTNLEKKPKVVKGHTTVLYCPVVGNPVPEILWLKNGEPIQMDNRIQIQSGGIQLKIQNATVNDTAQYNCTARNSAGYDAVDYNLDVYVPPSIDESNVVYLRKVIQNQTLLMECPVSGIPPPKIRWLINGEPFQLSPRMRLFDSNKQLEINSAQVVDTAIYTCIAENEAGELRKKFDVEVFVPPSINVSNVLTELTVIQNRTIFIMCPVSGIPFPSIMWLKDKFPLLDFPYKDLLVHDRDQRLEVSNAQVDDDGTYTCRATNPAGQTDQKYLLDVHVPPDIAGSEKVDIVTVVAGKSVTLNCIATGIPQPQLTWSKSKKIIVLSENPKIRILSGGQSLQITSAEVSHTGKYICYAENQAGITEKTFDVQVQVLPTIHGSERVQNKWVVTSQPLTLECPAEGIPTPQIKWVRQGEEIQQYGNPSIRIVDNGRRLLLVSSQLVDQGDYTCIASNDAGNASLEYILAVYVPPTIEDGPTEVSTKVQTGATLQCESIALPDPKIEWTKNGEPFATSGLRHRMLVSGTLEFTSVRIEDSGNYTCTASNEAGKASRNIRLNVQVPPRIVGEKFRHVKAVVGNGVYLPCDATGIPEPRIIWQKGTSLITGSEDIDILENGTLFLKKTTTKDEGYFVCMAQNNAGTDFGQFNLQIQVPPSINVRQQSFIVQQSRGIVLPCQANGRPRPQISWEKNGEQIKRNDVHYRLMRSGELAIPFARAEDAGIYKCIAKNDAGQDQVNLELVVQVPPEIEKESRLLTFSVAETASIPCNAKGNPVPVISWTKDGQALRDVPGKFFIDQKGTLLIYNLQEDDTGSYVCTAVNVAGRDSQERLLRIQVPPQFLTAPANQEVLVNDRLELSCFANGVPTPTIRWMRNNQIIPSQPSVNGRSLYIIRNVRPEDGGLYTCIAENPAGAINTTASVIVKVPPEIIAFPGNKAVTVAEKVILTCSVGGDPAPEIIWTKNGREVRYSERIQLLSNGSLVIFNSTSSDAGEYKCVATNDAGTSEGIATLTIREPPKFRIEPESIRVDEGTTAILNCVAEGEPKPEMLWMIGWEKLESDGRLTILPNNSIRIAAAQVSDSNTYRCLASNNLGKTFVEANITVVVHGSWSEWSSFGKCSLTCGQGVQQRTRSCDNPLPVNGGRSCIGESVEQRPCSVRQCPVDGQWGNWLPWEECSTTCGPGQRVRNRHCDNPAPQLGGQSCIGLSTEMTVCNVRPCPVNGSWSAWLPWQPCSQTCGEGHQERIRRCDSPRPEHGGQECDGNGVEKQTCKLKECAVDGNWGGWGEWARCSLSCGGGIRSRLRKCNNPGPEHGGLFCHGTDTQVDYCNSEPCPIHGNWSPWGDWGECSASCHGGLRKRFRTCSNPPPSNNGRSCIGPGEDSEPCNSLACPVDGRWGPWSDWSICSKTCDTGVQQRFRTCQQPVSGGRLCLGDATQVKRCSLGPCHKIPRIAEGNLVGYINNIDIPASTFRADAVPLPDRSATHVNATIRNVPRDVVRHFRNLISVLNPVYWTTATEVDGAYNGFSLTNGEFTRDVQVEFTTGEILKMSHYSKGVDANGVLQLDIVVRGTVPDIATTQHVHVLPYTEQYVQAKDGLIHARSSRMFSVNGFMLPYAWNHTINYSTNETMPFLVQELTSKRLDINIDPDGEVVRYVLDVSIAPGNPSNACPVGYSLDTKGPFCTDEDECSQNLCSHHCHNSPGSFACSCPVGYMLSMDGRNCLDIDECRTRAANCPSDQECVNTIGSYRCVLTCRAGYKRSEDGTRCLDINECKETPTVCDQHCMNRIGGFRCRCDPGYRKVGKGKCIDIDECDKNPCAHVCANMAGSYVCSCRQGYALVSGGLCRDVNECLEDGADCGQNQECVNEVGSYRCIDTCSDGYQRSSDGECIDVDECTTSQNRCYYNQQCVNIEGGYQCLCPRGYRSSGPGTPCLDVDTIGWLDKQPNVNNRKFMDIQSCYTNINECEEHRDVCAHKCQNTAGGFVCVCPPGQVLLFDRKSCAGLEFLEPSRVISTNEVNFSPRLRNPRSLSDSFLQKNYMSTSNGKKWCPPGFQYNSKIHSCIDIDECVEDHGVCQHNCTNTVGSYQCQCPPGYSLSQDGHTCQDIDECIEFNIDCGPEKMCFNTRGEFSCIDIPCPTNYQRDPITNYCVLECIDADVACPPSAKYADVIEFRTLALPSGILAHQDLLRLIAYNQNNVILRKTEFKIMENEERIPFKIRLDDGIGVLYTVRPLEDKQVYRIKVRARSFDNIENTIQYQTTFIIHISISAYPY